MVAEKDYGDLKGTFSNLLSSSRFLPRTNFIRSCHILKEKPETKFHVNTHSLCIIF